MKKKNLPRRQFKFDSRYHHTEGIVLGTDFYFEVDRLGGVVIRTWTSGSSSKEIVVIHPIQLRKLRDWVSKIIEFQERE